VVHRPTLRRTAEDHVLYRWLKEARRWRDQNRPHQGISAATEPLLDPQGQVDGRFRALRGGSWRVGREIARTTYRNGYRPDYAHSSIGFRIALEVRDFP